MENQSTTIDILEKMKEIAEGCMGEAAAYCEAACPMHTDARGYVGLIGEGKYEEALKRVRETLFLPATLGRICAHPCEDKCKRGETMNPLSIAALKRFVADRCDDEGLWNLTVAPENPQRIAVIGAGPAGAQAALDLRRKGYKVTVFDRLGAVGGMLRVGIPEYRLPRQIIDREYSLLEKIGVEFKLGVEIGRDIPFEKLRSDYDAVLIAVGAHKSITLPIPGSDLGGVLNAVDFLRDVSQGKRPALGSSVVVIGGGNVGIDVARTARRLGAADVKLVCLECREEMPAHSWELEEALEEGVTFHTSCGPVEILGEGGRVAGFNTRRCTSVFDDNGKFNPRFDDSDTCLINGVDNVIFAIGQSVDGAGVPDDLVRRQSGGRFAVDPVTLQTNIENVFAAGDATGRSVIAVAAMAEGRKAAESIDRYLTGRDLYKNREFEGAYETKLETKVDPEDPNPPRVRTAMLPPGERVLSFAEADLGFDEAQARQEASRCLACECKLCMKECEMLTDFTGCPGELFEDILAKGGQVDPLIPFSCNMCLQCTLVCPKEFRMMDRFMDLRIRMVRDNNGKSPIKGHKAIDVHQALGFSRFFNTGVAGGDGKTRRVFIPGCSLPSYNPELVGKVLAHLQERLPGTGAILKCCGKPTKALGQVDAFKARYAELQAEIDRLGAEEIIVACQSCYVTMKEYSPKQKVRSLWEVLPEIGLPEAAIGIGKDSGLTFAVHDSCPTRDVPAIQNGIRRILDDLGYATEEPPHTGMQTRCCGFGGMVVPVNPELAERVMKRRTAEVSSDCMVTYCAACRESMVRGGKKAVHILDLVFGGPWKAESEFPALPASPLQGWINRHRAKRLMRKAGKSNGGAEATKKGGKAGLWKLGIAAAVIAATVLLMKQLGLFQYVSMQNIMNLKAWIDSLGAIGPLVYVLLFVAACLFFLPGLPIAILGGLAFGPVMGTVWASIGSTLGATMAFLVSRYVARGMVEGWAQSNPVFKKIDDGVAAQGWRMLMITRLVPLFPFNMQNYAYGLTKIGLPTYVTVSWICMLPGAIAFTFMGGAIVSGEGNLGKTFMYLGIGAVVFVIISLIPGWIKKRSKLEFSEKENPAK
jgi:NADPH-dependent glutamate synthase beta subunit-like oxidoreductase/uncharacterized membrane protein YdjX (TVP38/TMEM64 family)